MTANPAGQELERAHRLVLGGDLAGMAKLPVWVDALSALYRIPEEVKFAINLCLEEAVSNVIRHGYAGRPDGSVRVSFEQAGAGCFAVTVEDDAPAFDPLAHSELPRLSEQDADVVGGQGIRLMRDFASRLEYQATAGGNRLRMEFVEKTGRGSL
jgi:anti-sigma regulatory factor (Ser/Thr protein kinase)